MPNNAGAKLLKCIWEEHFHVLVRMYDLKRMDEVWVNAWAERCKDRPLKKPLPDAFFAKVAEIFKEHAAQASVEQSDKKVRKFTVQSEDGQACNVEAVCADAATMLSAGVTMQGFGTFLLIKRHCFYYYFSSPEVTGPPPKKT